MEPRITKEEAERMTPSELVAYKQFLSRIGGTKEETQVIMDELKKRYLENKETDEPDYKKWDINDVRGVYGR